MGTIINEEKIENVYIGGNRIKGFCKGGDIVYKDPPYYLVEWTDIENKKYVQKIPQYQLINVISYLNNEIKTCIITSFNEVEIRDCGQLFSHFNIVEAIDLSGFDTSSSIHMAEMFYGCDKLNYINLQNLNTKKVKSMTQMFYSCRSIENLDLSSFNIENVTSMNRMFYNCVKLKTIDLSSFDFKSVQISTDMFYGVPSDCLIYVKDQTSKNWILNNRNDLTNVQIKE